jgi:transcriptional regulator with PAS, ATPase and Fis domain
MTLNPQSLQGEALLGLEKVDVDAFIARVREVYHRQASVRKAAEELGIGERTLQRRIRKYSEALERR